MIKTGGQESTAVAPSWGKRLIGLEGLRGLAAVTVLLGHVNIHMAKNVDHPDPIGSLLNMMGQGLTLFFALSGFLLFRPFVAGILDSSRRPSIKKYFVNRALRIYPAYLVILVIVCLVIGKGYATSIPPNMGVEGSPDTVGFVTDPIVLLTNALMLHTLFPDTIKTGLGVSWTLTVELVFYLVLPALAYTAYRLMGSRQKTAPMFALFPALAVLMLGVIGKLWVAAISNPTSPEESFYLNWGGNWTAVLARSFVAHADLFAFGMFAAFILVMLETGRIESRLIPVIRWGGMGVALTAILIVGRSHLADTGFALAAAALILFVVLPTRKQAAGAIAKTFEFRPIRYVGLVSYSLYLWHIPVIWVIVDLGITAPSSPLGFWANALIVLAVSTVLAALTYELVEKQAMRLKKRTEPKIAAKPIEQTVP